MATHADISGNLAVGALQSVRRNASNTTFEAYTTSSEVNYLVYAALLTQAGTVAPVAAVMQNTLGEVIWARSGTGQYTAALSGSSFASNTFVLTSALRSVGVAGMSLIYCGANTGTGYLDLVTAGMSVGPPVSIAQYDDLLTNAPVEIRVYLSSRMTGTAAGTSSVVGRMSGPTRGVAAGTATVTGRMAQTMRGTAAGTVTVRGRLEG